MLVSSSAVVQGPLCARRLQSTQVKTICCVCRYVYLFRSKLGKAALLEAFPAFVRLLQADSNVVHSYAAIVIERLLALHMPDVRSSAR
jgi:Cse1